MIDGIISAFKDVRNEIGSSFKDIVPNFAKGMESNIKSFAEADKSLLSGWNKEKIDCRNEGLAGKEHPETGVKFERKTIEVNGKLYEVVVPKFESEFEAELGEELQTESDAKQFKECNRQLKEAVQNDPELRKKFTEEQLEQINENETPDGYTWHHDAEVGKMQLVDSEIHAKTAHTGGKAIWGGGSQNR